MLSRTIAKFVGEYKANILGKKNIVSLYIYENTISGTGVSYFEGKFIEKYFDIEYQNIKSIEETTIQGNLCLCINYSEKDTLFKNAIFSLYFPNVEGIGEAKRILQDLQKKDEEERIAKYKEEYARKEQKLLEQKKRKEECQQYFSDCYNFHIANESNPYFELQNNDLQFTCIYIDKQKNLNFLKIDGYSKEESNAYISFDKIHYYEKAGNVYYTSDINGNFSNYGGSFTSATISKGATALGGLLFGTMGLAAGALLTHVPSKVEMPTSTFNISSEVHKIDDRSVVLNYYSDAKQQYMDMELPADIYNFLQTHLPEKKYGIVVEIEKKNAVKNITSIEGKSVEKITQNDDMSAFENKIKKLKMMYDNGILTEEEFVAEKKRILSEI